MAITASLRTNTDASYLLILFGAMMFGVSDNTLAYFKFNHIKSDMAAAFVMTTYYTAQCLLS
jgi:ABC-type Fe3+-siderophore transport system permease subunit